MRDRQTSIPVGSLWMVLVSVGLFFLPAVNGLIGGIVGGYKVGSVQRALAAAVLPAIVVGGALWLLLAVFHISVLGLFAGIAASVVVLFASGAVLVGALIGGLLGQRPALPPARTL